MGKKPSICKNEKKKFNSLIQVLRPKVYITNVSNFKNLVQELTGNNTGSSSSSITSTVPSLPYSRSQVTEHIPISICESEENQENNYMEMSLDTSVDSLNSWINEVIPTTVSSLPYSSSITTPVSSLPYLDFQVTEEIDRSWDQIYEDVTAFDSSMKQQKDFPTAEELELWLLDMEPTWSDNDLPKIEEEVNNMWLI